MCRPASRDSEGAHRGFRIEAEKGDTALGRSNFDGQRENDRRAGRLNNDIRPEAVGQLSNSFHTSSLLELIM